MKTFIIGASGFAKEVEWLVNEINQTNQKKITITAFVIGDNDFKNGEVINNIPIINETDYFYNYNRLETHQCFIAIGNPIIRQRVYDKINNNLTIFPTLIHPSVIFDRRANLVNFGIGSIICAGCILTTNIEVGNFVHLNLNSTVGHDSTISDFVTLSPSVNISGKVKVGNQVFIGTGAKINEEIEICNNVIIGAGAGVIKAINEPGTYVGIPVKKIK